MYRIKPSEFRKRGKTSTESNDIKKSLSLKPMYSLYSIKRYTFNEKPKNPPNHELTMTDSIDVNDVTAKASNKIIEKLDLRILNSYRSKSPLSITPILDKTQDRSYDNSKGIIRVNKLRPPLSSLRQRTRTSNPYNPKFPELTIQKIDHKLKEENKSPLLPPMIKAISENSPTKSSLSKSRYEDEDKGENPQPLTKFDSPAAVWKIMESHSGDS